MKNKSPLSAASSAYSAASARNFGIHLLSQMLGVRTVQGSREKPFLHVNPSRELKGEGRKRMRELVRVANEEQSRLSARLLLRTPRLMRETLVSNLLSQMLGVRTFQGSREKSFLHVTPFRELKGERRTRMRELVRVANEEQSLLSAASSAYSAAYARNFGVHLLSQMLGVRTFQGSRKKLFLRVDPFRELKGEGRRKGFSARVS